MNKAILKYTSKAIEKTAETGAKIPSWFGWYQPRVPQKLTNKK